ncbi:MAG TPA: hypothetical protein VHY08_23250, partial [Bacillota bacterium]|nr:hypothetical protein [Bacillota bacterium]
MNRDQRYFKVSKRMSFPMVLFICIMVVIALSLSLYAATLERRVINVYDDAEENIITGGMYLDNTDLEMIYDPDGLQNQLVGIRFTSITVPKGATITTAYVQFTTDEISTGPINLMINGEDADNSQIFAGIPYNIAARIRTTAQTPWSPADWNTVGEAGLNQRTPEIKSIIQEIIDRPAWASGNSIVIIISGQNGQRRCAKSYDGSYAEAPLLHIEYDIPITPTPTRPATATPTPTRPVTVTPTPTRGVSVTPSRPVSVTPTPTRWVSITPTRVSITPSRPVSITPTRFGSVTPTPTWRFTPTPTATPTPTDRVTPTPTDRATPTPRRGTPTPTPAYSVYYGHIHNHSYVSDGSGSPNQAYAYARDTAKLDFFSLADHSHMIDNQAEWDSIKNAANTYNQDGSFVAFWGFEWSSDNLGHVAVINSPDYCSAYDPATDTFPELLSWLSIRDCVAFFNHPGRQDWSGEEFSHFTTAPSDKLVGMELWNKSDAYNVYYYNNDGYYPNDGGKSWYDEAISRDWKIG